LRILNQFIKLLEVYLTLKEVFKFLILLEERLKLFLSYFLGFLFDIMSSFQLILFRFSLLQFSLIPTLLF